MRGSGVTLTDFERIKLLSNPWKIMNFGADSIRGGVLGALGALGLNVGRGGGVGWGGVGGVGGGGGGGGGGPS